MLLLSGGSGYFVFDLIEIDRDWSRFNLDTGVRVSEANRYSCRGTREGGVETSYFTEQVSYISGIGREATGVALFFLFRPQIISDTIMTVPREWIFCVAIQAFIVLILLTACIVQVVKHAKDKVLRNVIAVCQCLLRALTLLSSSNAA